MDIARTIDHTLLKAEATDAEIRTLVQQAIEYRFASVCVNGRWVELVRSLLHAARADEPGDPRRVAACAVVGFPLGANKSALKAIEASSAVKDGAAEIDMVISLGLLLENRTDEVRQEIFEVVRNARAAARGTLVKVILETAALTEEQIALGCRAATEAGADFVKTSTGFHPKGGATVQAVRWLKQYAPTLQVKASGGIRDRSTAEAMLAAGATRLGTSSGVAIVSASIPTSASY